MSSRVMVVGPLPPPVHGAALVTDWVRRSLDDAGARVLAVDTGGSERGGAVVHLSGRLLKHLWAIACLVRYRRGLSSVYLGGAGGLGLWYQVLVVAAARLVGVRTVFHHHSFAYLTAPRWSMRCLTAAGGSALEHVALCPGMAGLIKQRYPKVRRVVTCSNAALLPAADKVTEATTSTKGHVVLGHLSNLSVEKGLLTVLDTVRGVVAAGHDVRLLLGGPAATEEAQRLIDGAQRDLSEVLTYVGRVPREELDAFYSQVDLFLFPSTYEHEAEPLVVLEAARVGAPTIAYAVGCLADMVPEPAWLVDPEGDYPTRVVEIVAAMARDDARAEARERTATHFRTRSAEASLAHARLVERLITAGARNPGSARPEESDN